MRITFVLDHAGLSGGVRVVALYARALQERGHQVSVLSRERRWPGRRRRLAARFRTLMGQRDPSHLDGLPIEHRRLPWNVVPGDEHVPDADVIIATWWETAEWVAAMSPSKGRKAYFVQHHEVHEGQPEDRVRATWRLPMHKIAVSKWLVDLGRDTYEDDDMSLVPNAVDHELFSASPRSKQSCPTVGLMYRTVPYKGCDIAFEAIRLARAECPHLRVVAFGPEAESSKLPLPHGTEYTVSPPQERIGPIYASCDVWLFASRTEGYGLPLLEAMACRTPVIGTPAGAAPELIAGGGGMLVEPESPEAMAAAILRVASMPEDEWRVMSDAAHETASAHSWAGSSELFEEALRRTAA